MQIAAGLGLIGALPRAAGAGSDVAGVPTPAPHAAEHLSPPADGRIPVAFLIGPDAVVIDFAGPWELSLIHI